MLYASEVSQWKERLIELSDFANWAQDTKYSLSVTDVPEKVLAYLALELAGNSNEAVDMVKKQGREEKIKTTV